MSSLNFAILHSCSQISARDLVQIAKSLIQLPTDLKTGPQTVPNSGLLNRESGWIRFLAEYS